MRIRNRCTDPKMRLGCDGWSDVSNERAYNPFVNTTSSAKRLMVWVNRCAGVSPEGNLFACRATCDNPLIISTDSGNVPVAAPDGVYAVSRADTGTYAPALMVPSGATCTVTERTMVTLEEAPIVMLMDCPCFAADTAPYAIPVGGGVFLLALVVLIGGWPRENRESMHRPQGAQEADTVGRHVAHRHQGGGWLANRLRRRRGPIAGERRNHGNGCLRTGRWNNPVSTGESFLRGFGFQGGAGLAAMLASRAVGGGDHGLRLLHRGDRTLLNDGLGVAA